MQGARDTWRRSASARRTKPERPSLSISSMRMLVVVIVGSSSSIPEFLQDPPAPLKRGPPINPHSSERFNWSTAVSVQPGGLSQLNVLVLRWWYRQRFPAAWCDWTELCQACMLQARSGLSRNPRSGACLALERSTA